LQKFSPEGIVRTWLSGGAEWLPNMFSALAGQVQHKKPGG
jgi:hypothetical protein